MLADLYNVAIGTVKKLVPNFFNKKKVCSLLWKLKTLFKIRIESEANTPHIRILSIPMVKTICRIWHTQIWRIHFCRGCLSSNTNTKLFLFGIAWFFGLHSFSYSHKFVTYSTRHLFQKMFNCIFNMLNSFWYIDFKFFITVFKVWIGLVQFTPK